MHPIIPPGAAMNETSKIEPKNVGKIPGRFTAGRNDWTGIKGWEKKPSGIATLANAVRSGNGGLGFLCTLLDGTGLLGVDVDCMDPARAKQITDLAIKHLGPSPIRTGRPPKALLVYRRTFALPKTTHELDATNAVEMLADGQQFVVAGTHPKTGKPYTWVGDLTTPGDLTEVTQAQVDAFLAALAEAGFKAVGKEARKPGDGLNGNGKHHPRGEPAESLVPRLDAAGLGPVDAGGGKWLLTLCPWDEFHTDGRDDGAAYFDPHEGNNHAGGFDCKHAHCKDKGVGDVFEWLRVEESKRRTARFAQMREAWGPGPARQGQETAQEDAEPAGEGQGTSEAADPLQRPHVSLVDPSHLLQATDEPPFLIEGFLEAGALGMLWGPPEVFKSFIALDWSLCIAHGLPWHGQPVRKGAVIYIAGEGRRGMAKRVQGWMTENGVSTLENFYPSKGGVNARDDNFAEDLLSICEHTGPPALIVLDTLHRNFGGGDENQAKDVGELLDVIDRQIGQTTGATVLIVHHATKEGGVYRGSSALKGGVDVEYEVVRRGEALVCELICRKMKDAPRAPTLAISLEVVDQRLAGLASTIAAARHSKERKAS